MLHSSGDAAGMREMHKSPNWIFSKLSLGDLREVFFGSAKPPKKRLAFVCAARWRRNSLQEGIQNPRPSGRGFFCLFGFAELLIEEGDDLAAVADLMGGEGVGFRAAGDALLHRPGHRRSVVGVGGHIGKGGSACLR